MDDLVGDAIWFSGIQDAEQGEAVLQILIEVDERGQITRTMHGDSHPGTVIAAVTEVLKDLLRDLGIDLDEDD